MACSDASATTPACGRSRANGQRTARHRPGQGRQRRKAPLCCTLPSTGSSPQRPVPRRLTAEQQAFALSHLGLARQQARRFAIRHQLDYDELLGAAYEGLCKAALGFDPALGHRPSSYVVPKVKGELLHHLRDTGFALRICHRYRELWIKARRLVARGLEDQEISEALRVPVGVWVDVRLACEVPPVPLSKLHSQGIGEKVAAVECLSGWEY